MSAAAVIIIRRKKFIRRFTEEGATAPEKAILFAEVGMRRSWIFDQMVRRGVFVSIGQDRFYMNEQAAEAFLRAQRRRAWTIGGVLILLFLIFLFLSLLRQ